jgi:hypothetical protein
MPSSPASQKQQMRLATYWRALWPLMLIVSACGSNTAQKEPTSLTTNPDNLTAAQSAQALYNRLLEVDPKQQYFARQYVFATDPKKNPEEPAEAVKIPANAAWLKLSSAEKQQWLDKLKRVTGMQTPKVLVVGPGGSKAALIDCSTEPCKKEVY